jgi:hypothetical protein
MNAVFCNSCMYMWEADDEHTLCWEVQMCGVWQQSDLVASGIMWNGVIVPVRG